MSRVLGVIVVCACSSTPSATVANQQPARTDYAELLREVGQAEDDAVDRQYVDRGSEALLAAANTVLADNTDKLRTVGARRVLMTLETERDFAFLIDFNPTPSATTSCTAPDVFWLAGHIVRTTKPPPVIAPLARRMLRALDEPWTLCVQRIEPHEPGYSHVHAVALEIFDDMFDWSRDFEPGAPRCWETCGPEHLKAFRAWWRAHAPL